MNQLHKRIFEISYKNRLSHIGSCITAVDIIDEIYSIKKKDEPFILSAGHAGLALYVVIEKYGGINAEEIYKHHGVHPDFCDTCGIDCSTGSLGQGLPIAVGMALAQRNTKRDSNNVYCLISDGECAEGSIWEALRIANEEKLINLHIWMNHNGWGAYKKINTISFIRAIDEFYPVKIKDNNTNKYPFLKGQDAHYYVMNDQDYQWCGTAKI